MSAFLHSDRHTFVLAAEIVARHIGGCDDIVSTALSLRDANNKALEARYGDDPEPLGDTTIEPGRFTPRQINTMARSFAYQCSEGDVMETHPAAKLIEALIEATGGDDCSPADGYWSVA